MLDRDQDHNDLDKCLLTIKGRNNDILAVTEGEGAEGGDGAVQDLGVKVGDYRLDITSYNLMKNSGMTD